MLKSLLVATLVLALFSQGIVHAEKPEPSDMAPTLTQHVPVSVPAPNQNPVLAPLAARQFQGMPYQTPSPMQHRISMKALLMTIAVIAATALIVRAVFPSNW